MKVWQKIKEPFEQSPRATAFLIVVGIFVVFYFSSSPVTLEEENRVYFVAIMVFISWCFERRTKDVAKLSELEGERLAELWEGRVERAQRDLARDIREYVLYEGDFSTWNDDEEKILRFRKLWQNSQLMRLSKLSEEFKQEEERVWLKRLWEGANLERRSAVDFPKIPTSMHIAELLKMESQRKS
jgi:hypothetical protein